MSYLMISSFEEKEFIMNILKLIVVLSVGVFASIHADEDNFYRTYQEAAVSSAAGTPWSATRQIGLVQKANALRSQSNQLVQKKSYPISEEDLRDIYAQNEQITFFAYSSMIDRESGAAKAISVEGAATQTPAVAFGIQRTFNREMAAATVAGGWGALKRPNDLAILNVFEKQDAALNGVIFQLPLSDLLILSKREVGYDLIPVIVTRWSDAVDDQKEPEMFLAYTFQAPHDPRYTNVTINPVPGYFNFLQKGLNLMGEDFKAMWWATTFLADQKTRVNELPYHVIDLRTE
jgi:hypothetical protein